MTKTFGGTILILAFLALGLTRGIGQPLIARMPAANFDLKRDVAIMLTCKGNCYRVYKMCKKSDPNPVHQAYCTDNYNWCTAHCKTTYKGEQHIMPDILGNSSSGTQAPAGTGAPGGGGSKSGGAGIR